MPVKPNGPIEARVAFVGDIPDKQDYASGMVFVGYPGKLLNEILNRAGISRTFIEDYQSGVGYSYQIASYVYTTTLLKQQISGVENDEDFQDYFYEHPPKARRPKAALSALWAELKFELEALPHCNVIVALGDHALQALTGKLGVVNWRGSVLESTLLPGKKVIPMIHPAKVMREYSWKALCVLDAKRVVKQSTFPEIIRPATDFILAPSITQVEEFVEVDIARAEKLAFDIETRRDHISCFGIAVNGVRSICIPFISGNGNYWATDAEEARAWRAISKVMGSEIPKIAQNVQFDASYMAWHGCPVRNIFWDTMLAQSTLYPELEKSLAVLCSIYTEHPYYKAEGRAALRVKSEKTWNPKENDMNLWTYNSRDCVVTYLVQEGQELDFKRLRKQPGIHQRAI